MLNAPLLARQALWTQVATEAHAAGSAYKLAQSPLLTPEERDFYGDVIFQDEIRHAGLCKAMAREFGASLPINPNLFSPETTDLQRLVRMVTVERAFSHGALKAIAFWSQYGYGFGESFRQIDREEQPHIAHGRRILQRLIREQPSSKSFIASFRSDAVADYRSKLVDPFVAILT